MKRHQQQQQQQPYLLEDAITDLRALLVHLFHHHGTTQKFHLLGHSFGGLVAFECLKRYYCHHPPDCNNNNTDNDDAGDADGTKHLYSTACQSLILANVPYDVRKTMARRQQLRNELKDDAILFLQTYECRSVPMPLPLQQSLDSLRNHQTAAKDDEYYMNYCINGTITIRTALLFGEYDFVADPPDDDSSTIDAWKRSCPNSQIIRLTGCSHYSMVENDTLFNQTVAAFVKENDRP